MNEIQFRDRIRLKFPRVKVSMSGIEVYEIRQDDALLFTIGEDDPAQGVLLHWDRFHAHCDTLNEAFDLGWQLLNGEARWAEEIRDEELAATWLEFKENNEVIRGHFAVFFSALDEAEWTLRPGEVWRIRRHSFNPVQGGVEFDLIETQLDAPSAIDPAMFRWLDTALGAPVEGYRWTNAAGNSCLVQVPATWRTRPGTDGYTDFVSEGDTFLRVALYYREASQPQHPPRTQSIPHAELTSEFQEYEGWQSDCYQLTFHGDDQDMLARIELFWPTSLGEPTAMRESLRSTVPLTRKAPHEWHMGEG